MDSHTWNRLSDWYNEWLDTPPGDRQRVQQRFVAAHPELEADVTELLAADPVASGFLETSAFNIAIRDLAGEDTPLAAGSQVGPYRIVELLARGGMGEVYRATDVRLGRDVAVKVLSGASRHERDHVDRFLQEARVTAALDRPNIVRLFDVGVHDERPFLVMELLSGETLRQRLSRGRLSQEEAKRVALDIARGLTAAHAEGLIHRDLKPENLFITREGLTKILDFGVAKLLQPATVLQSQPATMAGMLVGTAGYLAPEQILGDAVDERADLFACGAILHEMLTGSRVFGRDHTIETLYAVLREPAPRLPDSLKVTTGLSTIIGRLLEKTPASRFHSAADLVWALEQPDTETASTAATRDSPPRRRPYLAGAAVLATAVVAVVAGAVWAATRTPPGRDLAARPELARFTWTVPAGMVLGSRPTVSPDGHQIAFVGQTSSSAQIFVRALAALEAKPIPGTNGARRPFWSPDGRSLGFFAGGKLLRVALDGGAPVVLADAIDGLGGTWGTTGMIVFQPVLRDSGLMQVPADGGPVKPATLLDIKSDDINHRWPAFLPDGIHFLYCLTSMQETRRGIYLGSIAEPALPAVLLFAAPSGAIYVPDPGSELGTILTARADDIEARTFNPRTFGIIGDPVTIPVRAGAGTPHHPAFLSASTDLLAVTDVPIPFGSRRVAIRTADGSKDVLTGPELGGWARISPDGGHLLRSSVDTTRGNPDIWIRDLARGTQLRVTATRDAELSPVWSPDGDRVAYRVNFSNPHIAITKADGTGTPISLPCPVKPCEPTDWSADGRLLLINAGNDVWTMPVDGKGKAEPLLSGASLERDARYSPNGRWVAYVSDESGHPDVFIRTVGSPMKRIVVSNIGGDQPVWKHDGSALFYVDHDLSLQRVPLHAGDDGTLRPGRPEPVNVPRFEHGHWGTNYDVSIDGAHIYVPLPPEEPTPREVTFVLGWRALLRR